MLRMNEHTIKSWLDNGILSSEYVFSNEIEKYTKNEFKSSLCMYDICAHNQMRDKQ